MTEYNNLNLQKDIERHSNLLIDSIENKKILVIGGAGSIGISYIKKIL